MLVLLPNDAMNAWMRRALLGLASFSAVSAIGGGAALVGLRHGSVFLPPIESLQHTPFASYLIPGLILGILIGGSSAACAILVWRRSAGALDAALFAGGALTVWIIAEVAMLRGFHWLHLLYGAIGLGILVLASVAGWQSGRPRHRWILAVTTAEAIGFLAPVLVGIFSTAIGFGGATQTALVASAGLIEGLLCGLGQAIAFPLHVRRLRYAFLTALGAGIVWAVVISALALAQSKSMSIVGVLIASFIALAAIGSAQWIELKNHVERAHRWIAWTALAWAVALPLSFAPSPFVDESTPFAANLALWGSAGLLMAYVMALISWQGARRLVTAPLERVSE